MIRDHECPKRGCTIRVANRLFACPRDWAILSSPVKAAIYATAGMGLLTDQRQDAIEAAFEDWGDL